MVKRKSNRVKFTTAKNIKLNTIQKIFFYLGNPFYKLFRLFYLFTQKPTVSLTNEIIKFFNLLLRKISHTVENKSKIRILKFRYRIPALLKLSTLRIRVLARLINPKQRKSKRSLVLLILLFFVGIIFWDQIIRGLPSPEVLVTRRIDISTKIYDRNGNLLFKIYKDKNRSLIQLSELPNSVMLATLAAEDAEYYDHFGFSLRGIMRALAKNAANGSTEGGSTITQQLVKNALLSPEKSVKRKVKELVLAVLVEAKFTKEQILEMYLNEVSYGGTAYGIEEASQIYFGKSANNLSLAQSALLAGIPKSPTRYSPFGSNLNISIERQAEVLRLMEINKFITHEQRQEALVEKLIFAPNRIDIQAPHFVMYTRELLEDYFGTESVTTGGFEVITALDINIQKLAEKALAQEIRKVKNLNVTNGSVLVINPQNGQILAMAGSVDYFDQSNDGNVNTLLSLRSPGSSIKMLTYAKALLKGYGPASILNDSAITFRLPNNDSYTPKNYDGKITLRNAFAQSRNVPAIRMVASLGVNSIVELGKMFGITSWDNSDDYGLSITLGGANVKLFDLAQVYAVVANYGKRTMFEPFLKITNAKGDKIMLPPCKAPKSTLSGSGTCTQEVLDPRVAYLLTNMLADNNARSNAFGRNSQLVIPNHPEVAVKTGTSNDLRDNVTIGYNQDYLIAVWVGNNDNSSMSKIASGLTGASAIWNKVMHGLLANTQRLDWPIPDGLEKVAICSLTATLPCSGCPTKQEYFLSENVPTSHCDKKFFEATLVNSDDKILDGQSTQF